MGEGHGERDKSAAMPENSNDDDDDDMALEMDPSHRFSRYHQKVGSGRFKRVYRGFDEKNGIDVAWSKIERHVNNMELDDETMERITAEMSKGLQLEHPNIIKCFRCDGHLQLQATVPITVLRLKSTLGIAGVPDPPGDVALCDNPLGVLAFRLALPWSCSIISAGPGRSHEYARGSRQSPSQPSKHLKQYAALPLFSALGVLATECRAVSSATLAALSHVCH